MERPDKTRKVAIALCQLDALDEFEPEAHGSSSFEFWIDKNWREYIPMAEMAISVLDVMDDS